MIIVPIGIPNRAKENTLCSHTRADYIRICKACLQYTYELIYREKEIEFKIKIKANAVND